MGTIGERIKLHRKERGITQKELARLTGLHEVTIRQYEAGKYIPKYEQLRKVAKALDTNINELYAGTTKEYTGVCDGNARELCVGDKVGLFGMSGKVVFECGAYGIGFETLIDWDKIEEKIPEMTGCNNSPCFCYNDNFVSFWELLWNFNCEDDLCYVVELLGQDGG